MDGYGHGSLAASATVKVATGGPEYLDNNPNFFTQMF
jgi:hypothetical protein